MQRYVLMWIGVTMAMVLAFCMGITMAKLILWVTRDITMEVECVEDTLCCYDARPQ